MRRWLQQHAWNMAVGLAAITIFILVVDIVACWVLPLG